jgi:hypothetical protein
MLEFFVVFFCSRSFFSFNFSNFFNSRSCSSDRSASASAAAKRFALTCSAFAFVLAAACFSQTFF